MSKILMNLERNDLVLQIAYGPYDGDAKTNHQFQKYSIFLRGSQALDLMMEANQHQ